MLGESFNYLCGTFKDLHVKLIFNLKTRNYLFFPQLLNNVKRAVGANKFVVGLGVGGGVLMMIKVPFISR